MPFTGNIIVDEVTDPESVVLQLRSGRIYPRGQTVNWEFLSNERLQHQATVQAQGDRSEADDLHMSRVMGETTEKMFSSSAPCSRAERV
jgi:hypothetical protein